MTNLPSNFAATAIEPAVVHEFIQWAQNRGVDLNNGYAFNSAWGQYRNLLEGGQVPSAYARTVLVGPYTSDNKLYDNGPFTWHNEDLISDVTSGGSPLLQWLPTGTADSQNAVVNHISWIAPENWTGTSYDAYLAGLDIAECEYGPSTKWNGFMYEETYGQFSFASDTFNLVNTYLTQFAYERDPRFRLRGPNAGLPLDNDEDFGIAQVASVAENHLAWNVIYGDGTNSDMEWNGLDQILTAGYVSARTVAGSGGTVDFADPVIISGAGLPTIPQLVQAMRQMVRFIRYRASMRQLPINDADMAFVMPIVVWYQIAEYLATNGMVTNDPNVTRNDTAADAESRLNNLMTGGLGWGSFMVDGRPVPILIDDNMVTASSGNQYTSDIFLLTRRAGGMNLLEQQYFDWDVARQNGAGLDIMTGLNGLARIGWVSENQECYYFFIKMLGRLLSRAQPYQGRITSVTVTSDDPFDVEAPGFTDLFYGTVLNSGTLPAGV